MDEQEENAYVLASSAGYGFIVHFKELYAKNRAGKAMLTVPEGYIALRPRLIQTLQKDYVAIVTNDSHLLIFKVAALPELTKGKGNKLISLPTKKSEDAPHTVVDCAVLSATETLTVISNGKPFKMKPNDWKLYINERAYRGSRLPRGCKEIKKLLVTKE